MFWVFKMLGTIGSVVLTFIGYKQTDKQSIYIDELYKNVADFEYHLKNIDANTNSERRKSRPR